MNVEKHDLLNLLSGDQQFEVPLYQRPYSWTDADRRQLWNDVLRAGTTAKLGSHFIGSLVYTQPHTRMGGGELEVPDGLLKRDEFEHREAFLPLTKAQFAEALFNVARRELEDYVRANGETLGALRQIDFGIWQESGENDVVGELALPIRWLNQLRPAIQEPLSP